MEETDDGCDIWANVDFGHGFVEVRCTRQGKHEAHICNVVLTPNRADKNIFEEE